MSAAQTSAALSTREPATEDRELPEHSLLFGREQVVAPGDRRLQRPLAFRCITPSRGQERETLVEALEKLFGWEQARSCGGELDREWQAVEPAADCGYRLDRLCGRRSLSKERDRVRRQEWIDDELVLT